jgi:glycyl-tRNA synthetase
VAVFPLVKKDGMPEIAEKLQADLRAAAIPAFYDVSGAIGRATGARTRWARRGA